MSSDIVDSGDLGTIVVCKDIISLGTHTNMTSKNSGIEEGH